MLDFVTWKQITKNTSSIHTCIYYIKCNLIHNFFNNLSIDLKADACCEGNQKNTNPHPQAVCSPRWPPLPLHSISPLCVCLAHINWEPESPSGKSSDRTYYLFNFYPSYYPINFYVLLQCCPATLILISLTFSAQGAAWLYNTWLPSSHGSSSLTIVYGLSNECFQLGFLGESSSIQPQPALQLTFNQMDWAPQQSFLKVRAEVSRMLVQCRLLQRLESNWALALPTTPELTSAAGLKLNQLQISQNIFLVWSGKRIQFWCCISSGMRRTVKPWLNSKF